MNVLVIGDVHGCYHTFRNLVENNWNKDNEFLVQVGDLLNKGLHSAITLRYFWKLQKKYPYQVFLVRGNNEQYIFDSYKNEAKSKWYQHLKSDLKENDIAISQLADWIAKTPLKWETPHTYISHAGLAKSAKNPYYVNSVKGVLHNRSALKNLGKIQIHGHEIVKGNEPVYTESSNSWNIDTGAWTGNGLSGIKLNRKGKLLNIIHEPTHTLDMKFVPKTFDE